MEWKFKDENVHRRIALENEQHSYGIEQKIKRGCNQESNAAGLFCLSAILLVITLFWVVYCNVCKVPDSSLNPDTFKFFFLFKHCHLFSLLCSRLGSIQFLVTHTHTYIYILHFCRMNKCDKEYIILFGVCRSPSSFHSICFLFFLPLILNC